MKELYKSPELDILCLRALERLALDDESVEGGNLTLNKDVSITYGQVTDTDSWVDIPL